eukprot:8789194-Alexandrium_andersonii.AAC.1
MLGPTFEWTPKTAFDSARLVSRKGTGTLKRRNLRRFLKRGLKVKLLGAKTLQRTTTPGSSKEATR